MARFYVMITDCCGIVTDIIVDFRSEVRRDSVNIVVIINAWLSLKEIPIVKKHKIITTGRLSDRIDSRDNSRETSVHRRHGDVVNREKITVNVSGVNDFYLGVMSK